MISRKLLHRKLVTVAVIIPLSLMFAASHLLIQQAMAPESYDITVFDFSINPYALGVEKGDTVVWTNKDPVIHTLWFVFEENRSTYLLSDPILPSQSWSHTFTEPVKLLCYCFERLWVTGKLRIFTIFGDVDIDRDVDVYDLFGLGKAYDSDPSKPNWNPDADFNWNNKIDKPDLLALSGNYGKEDP